MERISAKRIVVLLLVGAAVALLALILGEGQLRYLGRIVMLAGAAMSLNLLIGNAGLISMGHGLFMGIGAYLVAVPNVKYGMPLSWTIPAALLSSLVIGIVGSVIVLRARALFFSLLTLALGQVAYVLVSRNYNLTGGDDGLVGITVPALIDAPIAKYLVAVGATTATCALLMLILASPFGATLRAVRDNADRVASLGGNPKLYEAAAFVIAGLLGTCMGIVAAIIDGSVEPTQISWVTGATLLVMVALGGRSTFFGPALGVTIIELTRSFSQAYTTHANLIVGALVIICAVSFPEGILPYLQALTRTPKVPPAKAALGEVDGPRSELVR